MITQRSLEQAYIESVEAKLADYTAAIEAYRVWMEGWRARRAAARVMALASDEAVQS